MRIERENPARPSEIVGSLACHDVKDAAALVETAHRAQPAWARASFDERAAAIEAGCAAIDAQREDLAVVLCRELGKVLGDCRAELAFATTAMRDAIIRARRLLDPTEVSDDAGRLVVERVPFGVIGAVTPWNAPIILAALKVGPALATGNTIVVKPSPLAPLAVTRALALMLERLPAGVLSVAIGGTDVGEIVIGHPLVRKVAFTGGATTGRAIAHAIAERLTPAVMELGGNDPAIFLADADLSDVAMERAIFGTFLTSGQVCMAAKRLYVHASRADEFVEAYVRVASDVLVMGDPLDPAVTVGPVVTALARENALALLNQGECIELGRVEPHDDTGYFVRPTLVVGLTDDAPLVAREQFAPLVPVLTFERDDEVVERANASEYGLAASVWSVDEERAIDIGRRLECGTTFINTHNRSGMSLRAPFGGMKSSGYGREYGDAGVLEYVQTHAINAPAGARAGAQGSGRAYPS